MKLISTMIAAALAFPGVMQEAGGSESAGGGTSTGTEKKKRAPKTNLLDIVRGRMPLACVAAVRFQVPSDMSNNDVAKIFGTSVGKIFDIRKGRNFGYVTKEYKVTEQDLADAKKWAAEAAKHGGDEAKVMGYVGKIDTANAEEAKAQAEKITAARSKGPRQPGAKKEDKGGEATGGDAKDLLK